MALLCAVIGSSIQNSKLPITFIIITQKKVGPIRSQFWKRIHNNNQFSAAIMQIISRAIPLSPSKQSVGCRELIKYRLVLNEYKVTFSSDLFCMEL